MFFSLLYFTYIDYIIKLIQCTLIGTLKLTIFLNIITIGDNIGEIKNNTK